MRQLGEQWIEEIDGKRHMLKAAERKTEKQFDCSGCFYNDTHGKCLYRSQDCPIGYVAHGYIKDLGILNDDGLLPCPFCGEYPVVENAYEGFGYTPPDGYWRVYHCSNDNHEISTSSGKRRQESIDAWNRRA